MTEFLRIITDIILPIFLIVGVGFVMDRRFRLDVETLSKLNFYVFVPALLFVKLLKADISGPAMLTVAVFTLVQMAIIFAMSILLYSHRRLQNYREVLALGSMFNNCGNYGIPLVLLAFGEQLLGPLAVIIAIQNLANFTFGIWLFERKRHHTLKILKGFVRVPVVYALLAAVAMRYLELQPLPQIAKPLEYLSDGLVSIALITLGVQLSRSLVPSDPLPLAAVSIMRLVVSPILTAALIPFFGWDIRSHLAAMIIVIAGMPVAVNVYIIAAEYRRDEALASQSVFWTTLLSPITLAILLTLCR